MERVIHIIQVSISWYPIADVNLAKGHAIQEPELACDKTQRWKL